MLRPVGSFLASVEDIWDADAIAVVAAFATFISHVIANVWMVWTVEIPAAAKQGKDFVSNDVTLRQDCIFKTGIYAYDFLMWALQLPFMVLLGFVVVIGFFAAAFGIGAAVVGAVERFKKLKNRV